MGKTKLRPGISSQFPLVALVYRTDEARKPAVVSKIMELLRLPNNGSNFWVPILNDAVTGNKSRTSIRERTNGYQKYKVIHICNNSSATDGW